MTVLDETIPAKVLDVVQSYGVTVDWIANPNDASEKTHSVTVTPPESEYKASGQKVSKRGNLMFVLPGLGLDFSPNVEDRVLYQGKRWIVESIQPYVSGDSVAAYNVEMSR